MPPGSCPTMGVPTAPGPERPLFTGFFCETREEHPRATLALKELRALQSPKPTCCRRGRPETERLPTILDASELSARARPPKSWPPRNSARQTASRARLFTSFVCVFPARTSARTRIVSRATRRVNGVARRFSGAARHQSCARPTLCPSPRGAPHLQPEVLHIKRVSQCHLDIRRLLTLSNSSAR